MTDTIPDWMESVPDELKDSNVLKMVPDVPTLAKNYLNQDKVVNSSIRLPSDDDDSKQKFAERVGKLGFSPTPEVPEDYELNGVGDADWQQEWLNDRKAYYKEVGMTKAQAETAYQRDLKQINDYEDNVKTTTAVLKEKYGANLESLAAGAERVIEKYGLGEIAKSPLGATPEWNKAMIELGKLFKEDGNISGEGGGDTTISAEDMALERAQLMAEMSELQAKGKMTQGHPEAEAFNLKYNKFLSKAHGLKEGETLGAGAVAEISSRRP